MRIVISMILYVLGLSILNYFNVPLGYRLLCGFLFIIGGLIQGSK